MVPRIRAIPTITSTWICVLWLLLHHTGALNESRDAFTAGNRRRFLTNIVTGITSTSVTITALPLPSIAARGAAELDFEYYARDLFGGNRREGNVDASKAPPVPSPRAIQEPLLSMLLSEDSSCIPKRVLSSMLQTSNTAKSRIEYESLVQDRFFDYRARSAKAFYQRAPYATESLSDQYYFDLSAYAQWRTAAELLPNLVDRDAFVRQVGRDLYQGMITNKLVAPATPSADVASSKISELTPALRDLLQAFVTAGFVKSYDITGGGDSSSGDGSSSNVFDDLDDEAIVDGASVDCLIAVLEPATLGAALQITGEQSRFAPDYIGSTVAALLETANLKCTWETYFVDNEYRPNPKDYFPNEQLFQFTIQRARVA
jgi:hypothetical protein